jgi:PAS domain-containing protein
MPLFYDLAFKQEWRILLITLFAGLVLANLLVSVSPIIESGKKTAIKEVGKRAQFMARQIVERNTPYLVARTESKTEIGSIEREDGVRVAVLMDLDSRILAPSAKFNQHLVMGGEAKLAAQARDLFRKGKETGVVSLMDGEVVGAVEPVKIYNPHQGKNVIVGMALVSLDASLSTLDVGEMGVIYSETLVYTAIIGGLILLVLYRLTLKPFQVLNDDIDKVLKGEISQVTHEFKIEELNPLWDVINSALQRIPGGDGSAGASGGASAPNPEEFVGPLKMMGEQSPNGVVVCDSDRRVLYANSPFEEMTGIRTDNVVGSPLTEHARDQAFSGLLSDLFDRASSGGDGVTEEFEFSGVQYRCSMAAFGPMGGPARAFVFMAERKEG